MKYSFIRKTIKIKIPFNCLVFLFLIACAPSLETVELKNEAGQVTARYTQEQESGLKEGKSYLYDAKGKIISEGNYRKGLLQGERKVYHENGEIQAIEQYKEGQFEGLFKGYYKNSQLKLEGHYANGEMDGEWKRYYDSGELMEKVTFRHNEENGPFTEYYKNGQTKTQGIYLNGDNEHGELKIFDETGELVKKMDCDLGVCHTTWKKEAVVGE